MNKQNMLYERFRNIEPSSTLKINEISNKLLDEGKNVYKFGATSTINYVIKI